jgi:murein L,D-transpeptidase YcbB/YkuD
VALVPRRRSTRQRPLETRAPSSHTEMNEPAMTSPRLIGAIVVLAAALGLCASTQTASLPSGTGARLWVDAIGRPTADAGQALQMLARAREEGLDPDDYDASDQQRAAGLLERANASHADIAAFDARLTASVAQYVHDVHEGRVDPRSLGFRMNVPPDAHDFTALVTAAVADHRLAVLVEEFTPRLALYRNLRSALARYRLLAADAALEPPPSNVPVAWRVRQIELALERLRWLPHLGDERFVAVNIPMFRLWAFDALRPDGMASFQTRVIVGRALNTRTPVFTEEMQEVIFRPYWNVPTSIIRNEILPALARRPDYLRAHNMEVISAPGAPLRVRQRPGPSNALGLVKFVFPNDDNVYMHATPAPALFGRPRRDFSHGCVRVEDPVGLAEWALADRPEWTRERILAAMNGQASIRVELPQPIRVILFYLTAVVTPEDGAIHFAEDIYGHDARLHHALTRKTGS